MFQGIWLPGQWGDFAPLLDAEASEAIGASQCSEALIGNTGRPSDKLQQSQTLLVVEVLHCCPEPAHHDVAVVVAWNWRGKGNNIDQKTGDFCVLVFSQGLHFHLLCTQCCSSSRPGRSQLYRQSPAPARGHQTRTPAWSRLPADRAGDVNSAKSECVGDSACYLVESSDQRLRLLHDPPFHPPLGHPLYVVFFVFLSHLKVGAARLQLPLRHLPTQRVFGLTIF